MDVLPVLPQLGAAKLVGQGEDAVQRAAHQGLGFLGQPLADGVHAPHRGQNVNFVADAHVPPGPQVAPKAPLPGRQGDRLELVVIVGALVQVGAEVVGVHPLPGGDVLGGPADDFPVLDDELPLGDGPPGHLVARGHRAALANLDGHIVPRVDDTQAHSRLPPPSKVAMCPATVWSSPGYWVKSSPQMVSSPKKLSTVPPSRK